MAVLDLQRRAQQTGRIRGGTVVKTGKQDKNGKDATRPVKLDTLRFTSPSRYAIEAVAERYGGEVHPWEDRGRREWDVVTKVSEIMVAVPPGIEAITIWYELWSGGGCQRRCDSQREQKSGGPCLCPHAKNPGDPDEVEAAAKLRAEMSKRNPPQACALKTRVNLVLPDLPDVGVWRLDTASFYAAGEMLGKAELMELCRERNVFLPARLWIDHRTSISNGQTKRYPVWVLELLATFRQITSGALESGGWAAQLPPAPGEQPKAITAAPATAPVPAARAEPAPQAEPELPPPPADEPGLEDWERAEQIAARGRSATSRREIEACAAEAEDKGLADEHVCSDRQSDTWEPLTPYLQDLWRKRAAA